MAEVIESYTAGEDDSTNTELDAGNNDYCQTFTIGTTGVNIGFKLNSVKLKIDYNTFEEPQTATLKIISTINGIPDTSDVIATSTTTLTRETADNIKEWFTFEFSGEDLIKGRTYGLWLNVSAGPYWRGDGSTPTYTGGLMYYGTDMYLKNAADWSILTGFDGIFIVYGGGFTGTLCSYNEVVTKAGSGVSTSAISESAITQFVKQAQSEICAITRFNWVEKYAELDTNLKNILNDICSNIAAIYCINYDLSGYTGGSLEAQRMIENYRDRNKQLYRLLENQEVKTFICEK
jgi:hypothetical protein